MLKTIRSRVVVAGVAVLVLCAFSAGAGLWMTSALASALGESSRSAEVLRNHMQADMMHDALRSDVLSAILATDPSAGVDLADVRTETADHVKSFRDAISANQALATDPEVKTALGKVEAPLQAYIASAEQIVRLAGADPAAARAGQPAFKQAFLDLEGRMETTAGEIEASAEAARLAAEAQSVFGQRLMMAAMIAGLLFSLALFAAATRVIVNPIRALANEMRALASGRTDVDLASARRGDEIGAVGRAVGDLQNLIVQRMTEEAAEADRRRALEEAERTRNEAEKAREAEEDRVAITALGEGLAAMAGGNLTHRFTAEVAPKAARLKEDFNRAIVQLQEAMGVVVTNVSAIRSG
ncbi:HAMP domain-containing protein, partial [Brevundimonas sp. Root1279]|uniref:HAMP domain-containing protein n=1 Tax=Brevundimonas sp. Root1279 TaxID=1736443 RepID=UPI00138F2507